MVYITIILVSLAVAGFAATVLYDRGVEAGEKVAVDRHRSELPAVTAAQPFGLLKTMQQAAPECFPVEILPPTDAQLQYESFLRGCAEWNDKLLHLPIVKMTPFNVPETRQ